MDAEYPEHEKLQTVQDKSQVCGEFLEWLNENGYSICETQEKYPPFLPTRKSFTTLLDQFFDINGKALENEKRQMLKELRKR
jgi:hypothetical protein